MAADNLLPAQVKWARNGAVTRIVEVTGASSYKVLVHHDGGQGRHLWLNPTLAAFVASQASSPRGAEFSKVSEADPCQSVKLRLSSERCLVEALSGYVPVLKRCSHVCCTIHGMQVCTTMLRQPRTLIHEV